MIKRLISRKILIEKLWEVQEHLPKTAKIPDADLPLGVVPTPASSTVALAVSDVLTIVYIPYLPLLHFSRI